MAVDLTHKLIRTDKDFYTGEIGSLKLSGGDEPTLVSGNGTVTSSPFTLNAGDTISFVSNLPIHHIHTGGVVGSVIVPEFDYDTRGEQFIATCEEYVSGSICNIEVSEDQDRMLVTYTASSDCVVFIGSVFSDDLTGLKITINHPDETVIIEEPIGFDNLQMQIKRHDYHGIGAEVSVGELEFYRSAHDLIKGAYDYGIDGCVNYLILNGETVVYSGKVDLTTCSFLEGDYASVKAKVGEIGSITTFNNRSSIDVDLTTPTTIDGESIEPPAWKDLHIPLKHLCYTNKMEEKNTRTVMSESIWGNGDTGPEPITGKFVLSNVITNEFGKVSSDGYVFQKGDGFDAKYGTGTQTHLDWNIKLRVSWSGGYVIGGGFTVSGEAQLRARNGQVIGVCQFDMSSLSKSDTQTLSVNISPTDYATDSLVLGYMFWQTGGNAYNKYVFYNLKLEVIAGSNLKMTMYDNLSDTNVHADMLMVHDALNVVSQSISEKELTVKSDWYRTPESFLNPGSVGGGALKALTNGYHIRGLFTNGQYVRNMPLSFKSLIKSLDALDCIGWGFSVEDDELYVRVERWDWFYKDDVILTLTNVAEVTTEIDVDRVPTELKIGYKKYATQDQYNSIDSPHGTRTFTSGIKAIFNELSMESEFIADNYAIEETRRARKDVKETEEMTYDESIFVFELLRTEQNDVVEFSIGHTATNTTNVGRAQEFINAKLTPRHMAARWRDCLFITNNSTPFRFTSGEINYKSSFGVIPEVRTEEGVTTYSLRTFEESSPQIENANILCERAKFKAEKITFSCPISKEEYDTIKANPYGLVSVNGKLGWIMEFKYKFMDGMADFTLIAKYTN